MQSSKVTFFTLYFATCVAHVTGVHQHEGQHLNRKRRTVSGTGSESCLQIYSVPRRSVVCEASQAVKDDITNIQRSINAQKEALKQLSLKIELVNPDKAKELPEEVKTKLSTIDEVSHALAGHDEHVKHLETKLVQINERMQKIELADRKEMTRLVELQTSLIELTLRQSNASLHNEYIDTLNKNTHALTGKLKQLEVDLNNYVRDSEARLEGEMKSIEQQGQELIRNVQTDLGESINTGSIQIKQYQDRMEKQENELNTLFQAMTSIREHQAQQIFREEQLKNQLNELSKKLEQSQNNKSHLTGTVKQLTTLVDLLTKEQNELKKEVKVCLDFTYDIQSEISKIRATPVQEGHFMPRNLKVGDCQDALRFLQPASGVYSIDPTAEAQPFDVFCEMDGARGWTVIQRRQDGKVNFFRGWNEYKEGFGDVSGEHWLGLGKIYELTSRRKYQLRVDLQDFDGKWWFSQYDDFGVGDEDERYALHVSGYHGDAGDSLRYHDGMSFSTYDKSNDRNNGICATWCHGAWWYKDCFHANLNGRYYAYGPYRSKTGWGDGVVWRHIKGTNFYSLKSVVMKIRPNI